MGKSESSKKAIVMTIITALVTRALKKKNDKKHELVTADSKELTEKDLWIPLQPIGTIYFLTHPKKAVYFFLLQKSLMFSWRLARKYFNTVYALDWHSL